MDCAVFLTLDQHIGVRIPGGQPNLFKHLQTPIFPKASKTPELYQKVVPTGSSTLRNTHVAEGTNVASGTR